MTAAADELVLATRALLAEPLMVRGNPMLPLVRRHRAELTRWFADELGYRLDAGRSEVARLAKLPGAGHASRGLTTRQGRPFDGRRYAVLCLVLAETEAAGERTTLARLFEGVNVRASSIAPLHWNPSLGADRRTFIQAVQAAMDLGVLERAEGDEERFARGDPGGDALYRVDIRRLAMLPTAPQPPSLAGSPEQVGHEAYPLTDDGRARRRRHRVTRALVEQPIVYRDDLSPEEVDYLNSQRSRLQHLLLDRVGLDLEVRSEGWVTVDADGGLTDRPWPAYGTAETIALLLCDALGDRHRRDLGDWPMSDIAEHVRGLAGDYAGFLRQGIDSREGADAVTREAIVILLDMRLIVVQPEGVRARPGVGRFATSHPRPHAHQMPLGTDL